MKQGIVIRPTDWGVAAEGTVEMWKCPHHLYRGMTEVEYMAHHKAGYIKSTGRYSHESEGTNFATDPEDAEAYVNSGRDDPRRTGKPTYLVEIPMIGWGLKRHRDGYYKTQEHIPTSEMTRVWRFDGNSHGELIGLLVWRKNT